MHKNILEGISILDFSTRLPGPFGSMVLASLGAEVTKFENSAPFDDPFKHEEIYKIAPNFKSWYENLNRDKNIECFDFEQNLDKLEKQIQKSDIIIYPASKYFEKLKKRVHFDNKIVIKLAAGKGKFSSAHDLNILALTKSFSAHINQVTDPPYLPFAGMAFGQYISTFTLGALIKREAREYTLYMSEIVPELFNSLDFPEFRPDQKYLHSGLFPAYNVYYSKDRRILCLAAMEEKFWHRFCELFEFEFSAQDRFDTQGRIQNIIEKRFAKLSSNEIQDIVKDENICLTIN